MDGAAQNRERIDAWQGESSPIGLGGKSSAAEVIFQREIPRAIEFRKRVDLLRPILTFGIPFLSAS
jgi:hypothetical protein